MDNDAVSRTEVKWENTCTDSENTINGTTYKSWRKRNSPALVTQVKQHIKPN